MKSFVAILVAFVCVAVASADDTITAAEVAKVTKCGVKFLDNNFKQETGLGLVYNYWKPVFEDLIKDLTKCADKKGDEQGFGCTKSLVSQAEHMAESFIHTVVDSVYTKDIFNIMSNVCSNE